MPQPVGPTNDPLGDFTETTTWKVAQGAAGTTALVTPGATQKVYVTGIFLTLDAAGTVKFTETAGDITGAMNVGGAAAPPFMMSSDHPILWTSAAGEVLSLVTVTGKANGWLTGFLA